MEWYFYNFTNLFLKGITTDIIYWDSTNWENRAFCIDTQFYIYFHPHVSTASFYILMWMSASVVGTRGGSFCFLRVPVSQNDCFMRVKLSVFAVYWVSVIAPSRPQRVQSAQDLATKWESFGHVFML